MDRAPAFMQNNHIQGAFMWKVKSIVNKGDYNYALVPDHPNCTKNGYVLEHRIVVENHLQRLLTKEEIVHHINGNKKDNRIENLEVMNYKEHVKHHKSQIGKTMLLLQCPECGDVFSREKRQSHIVKKGIFTACSNSCRGKFSRKLQLFGKTHKLDTAISANIVREFNSLDNTEETFTQVP